MSSSSVKAVLKVASTSDNISGLSRTISGVVGKVSDFNVSSLLKNMDAGSFAKKFSTPISGLAKNSNIVDVSKSVTKYADAIPKSADDILGSLSSVDEIADISGSAAKSADNIADSADSLKSLSNIENARSLSKIQAVSSTVADLGTSSKKISGVTRRLDGISDAVVSSSSKLKTIGKSLPDAKNVDEIADAIKSSKGVVRSLDEVGEGAVSIAKKTDDIADLASGAKKVSKFSKSLETAGVVLQVGVLAGYYLGVYLNNRGSSNAEDEQGGDPLILVTDPASTVYEVAEYEDPRPTGSTSVEDLVKSREFIIGAIAVAVVMVV